jgi:putative NADH-flavin reductase
MVFCELASTLGQFIHGQFSSCDLPSRRKRQDKGRPVSNEPAPLRSRFKEMKIIVLGAAGRIGRLVIQQALARGDEVVAYARNPEGIPANPGLEIVAGELADFHALAAAINGTNAVLVCLGTKGKRMKKSVDLMQKCMPLIIEAMQCAKVSRLVLLSAYGVGDTARTAGLAARFVYKMVVSAIYLDKERSEALLPGSGLKWTNVYPVILTDGPPADAVEVRPMTQVQKVVGLPKVSRADVARVMLNVANDDRTIGQRLIVSSMGSVR